MKEQIHAPIGEGSDKADKEGAPKALSKPSLPKGLENVQVLEEKIVGWRCWCGNARAKGYGGCHTFPIFNTDGWSGGNSYDGRERCFSPEELETYRDIGRRDWK